MLQKHCVVMEGSPPNGWIENDRAAFGRQLRTNYQHQGDEKPEERAVVTPW
jgi:hypothetical protein